LGDNLYDSVYELVCGFEWVLMVIAGVSIKLCLILLDTEA